jgi:dTDP-4-amino-4,6-dideoxygalactose transaminase
VIELEKTKKKKEKFMFPKEFTRQEPIPSQGIERAIEIMQSGRLHRYNTLPGKPSETDLLEQEFAEFLGRKYCLACSSCGSSIHIALRSAGVKPGDKVLCNAFTLAPVPGAVHNAGAAAILVDIISDYTIDFEDLEKKALRFGAGYLLLSHMRGHMADMDRIIEVCRKHKLILIEDCAHTLGASWDGRLSGTYGLIGCFSTQTYKHMNSGEGGLLVTDDKEVMAQAILYSGSYMLYKKHFSRPPLEVFEKYKMKTPNFSQRMDNLRAAILRPQLRDLNTQCGRWNERYRILESELNKIPNIYVPERHPKELYVGSSIQFSLQDIDKKFVPVFLDKCRERGVEIKWFGRPDPHGFTSSFESWTFLEYREKLPSTRRVLDFLCDIRIPLTFTLRDCRQIARIIRDVINEITASVL